jgi:hypothetical protein
MKFRIAVNERFYDDLIHLRGVARDEQKGNERGGE